MYPLIQLLNGIASIRSSISHSALRHGALPTALVLACFALSPAPKAFGVTPAPDGGYANGNTAEGDGALFSLSGSTAFNTAIGFATLNSDTTGDNNTANGWEALFSNTTGRLNTATGSGALVNNTTGNANTANGVSALEANTTGIDNTATGVDALFSNTTGSSNTANGVDALRNNTTGDNNTANGLEALFINTTGSENTATGFGALLVNTTGGDNTATGDGALQSNTNGGENVADGAFALFNNTSGSFNTAAGDVALHNNTTGTENTAGGLQALSSNTTGNDNTAVGAHAGQNLTTGSNNITIGANVPGVAGESKTIRIGSKTHQKSAFIAGISGTTVPGGIAVIVDSNGHLGTTTSSARFKDGIKPMDKASEAILALQPVTFHYKQELDPDNIPQFGLVAEQVEKVNPDLVARDDEGKAYTVRYEAVNAMLLNEFLKEHRKVEQLQSKAQEQERNTHKQEVMIAKQQKQIEALTTGLKEQASQIRKVTRLRRVEVSKAAPQLVANNR